MKPVLLYVMPAMMALFMVWQPVALQLSFLTSMILGVAQNQLFRRPWFREQFNMPPIIKPPTSDAELAQEQSQSQLSNLKVIPPKLKYQPPTAQGTINATTGIKTKSAPAEKGIIGGMKSEFKGAAHELQKKFNSFAATNTSSSKSTRPKSFVQSAEAYERRRKQEKKEEQELQRRIR
jgi:YidC/Oxa1 family membrane protein insertase